MNNTIYALTCVNFNYFQTEVTYNSLLVKQPT